MSEGEELGGLRRVVAARAAWRADGGWVPCPVEHLGKTMVFVVARIEEDSAPVGAAGSWTAPRRPSRAKVAARRIINKALAAGSRSGSPRPRT